MGYLTLIILTTIIGLGAQFYVNSQIARYSEVPTTSGLTGHQAAANMLAYHGITNVPISQGGARQDYFDPTTNSITIDPNAYSSRSITAIATACHEVGHACQYAQGYWMMKLRTSLVPAVNLASRSWMLFLFLGFMLYSSGSLSGGSMMINVAIALFAVAVLFHLVTLPVELDASRRAMNYLEASGFPAEERAGAFSVLRACAFTYVAAALASILQLLWLLGQRNQ